MANPGCYVKKSGDKVCVEHGAIFSPHQCLVTRITPEAVERGAKAIFNTTYMLDESVDREEFWNVSITENRKQRYRDTSRKCLEAALSA